MVKYNDIIVAIESSILFNDDKPFFLVVFVQISVNIKAYVILYPTLTIIEFISVSGIHIFMLKIVRHSGVVSAEFKL